jgi:hypothetical protein
MFCKHVLTRALGLAVVRAVSFSLGTPNASAANGSFDVTISYQ